MTGQTISHYKILEKLGEGGMGVVYKARDTVLDRFVALKFLPGHLTASDAERARFFQEAKAASALNHPNACTIYRIDQHEGQYFIEMEYVDGSTLREKIPVARTTDAIAYAMQIGEALQEAHAKGIVHRDIKAENIMVNSRSEIKVMDFGLAKLKGSMNLTRTSSTVGTLAYMAPEQMQGGEADARSDIFSFGVVLFEMLAGRTPFRGEHEAAMMYSIVNEEPEPIAKYRPDVSPELERIVKRALEKDPSDRYQSAADMVSELGRLQKQTARVPVAAVRRERAVQKTERPRPRTWLFVSFGGALLFLAAAGLLYLWFLKPKDSIRSMAVLPLVNVGGNPDSEYLSDGFTESLINTLSKLPGVKMMSSSSVFRFKGKDTDPQTAAHELGVGAVLTGRIRKQGDDLTISVELINAQDNSHIWGGQYTRNLSGMIGLESEISREVSNQLKITLTGDEQKHLTEHGTENTEALELYMKGLYALNKRSKDGFEKARQYFQGAIDKDPSYAQAYAKLADVYELMGSYYYITAKDVLEKTQSAILKALELDPSLGEAHVSMAVLAENFQWDWATAEREYKKGLELNPNYATGRQWYGEFLMAMGKFSESREHLQKARELDPLAPVIYAAVGNELLIEKRFDEAIAQFKKSIELESGFSRSREGLSMCYFLTGRSDESLREIDQAIVSSDSAPEYISIRGYLLGRMGRTPEAKEVLALLLGLSEHQYMSPFLIGVVYTGLDDKDRAFQWFDRAADVHDNGLEYAKVDPTFDPLRTDRRFQDLLRKVGL